MSYNTKIASCNYCGTRAALVLRGRERHELVCSTCGAPLHDLKMMPSSGKPSKRDRRAYGISHKPEPKPAHPQKYEKKYDHRSEAKYRKKRKKKSLMRGLFSEAIDLIEDIFD